MAVIQIDLDVSDQSYCFMSLTLIVLKFLSIFQILLVFVHFVVLHLSLVIHSFPLLLGMYKGMFQLIVFAIMAYTLYVF